MQFFEFLTETVLSLKRENTRIEILAVNRSSIPGRYEFVGLGNMPVFSICITTHSKY